MFKARMKFAKEGRAKYISHLDLMHAMQRSMARCQMPLWFTEGFNQHAYVSVALPLSTGYSGECEFLDFNITAEAVPENAVEALNDVFPEGLRAIVEIVKRSKRGEKTVNMRELMRDLTVTDGPDEVTAVVTTAAGNNNMSPEYLTRAIRQYLPQYEIPFSAYHRMNVFTSDGTPFR